MDTKGCQKDIKGCLRKAEGKYLVLVAEMNSYWYFVLTLSCMIYCGCDKFFPN